jgi:CDP-diacylglycerol--glycerol-3-phosphate 3-phosphatidyltransferase
MAFNLPNLLTWQRILAIPLLVCVYLVPFDAWGEHSRNLVATILFILASLTDWLDGWLARRLGQQTELGAFLDPVADKLLVCVALVMLLDLGRINAGIAIIIIGREITISALREWMASIGARKSVAVNWMGKVKTAVQMLAIPMLLYHDPIGSFDCQYWGSWMITLAAIQTFISMAYYLKQAWPQLRGDTGAH